MSKFLQPGSYVHQEVNVLMWWMSWVMIHGFKLHDNTAQELVVLFSLIRLVRHCPIATAQRIHHSCYSEKWLFRRGLGYPHCCHIFIVHQPTLPSPLPDYSHSGQGEVVAWMHFRAHVPSLGQGKPLHRKKLEWFWKYFWKCISLHRNGDKERHKQRVRRYKEVGERRQGDEWRCSYRGVFLSSFPVTQAVPGREKCSAGAGRLPVVGGPGSPELRG